MPDSSTPKLTIALNFWTMWGYPSADAEWNADQRAAAIKEAGFDAIAYGPDPAIKEAIAKHGLRFGGAFDASEVEQFEPKIKACLEIDNGPINCQLCDHDTPVEEAVEKTVELMKVSESLGAEVHLEMHRDTCTETPEKQYAIIEGVLAKTGKKPRVNFDFSHPGIVKHLNPDNYAERLFEDIPCFQASTLWHMRPFNGHHCQIPITDGNGNFSPEYEDIRPFIKAALEHWLAGPKPNNELWVVPELGPTRGGYGLSCFPTIWEDAIVLGKDIQKFWAELTA